MTTIAWMWAFIMIVMVAIFFNVWREFTQKTREMLKVRREYRNEKREDELLQRFNNKETRL